VVDDGNNNSVVQLKIKLSVNESLSITQPRLKSAPKPSINPSLPHSSRSLITFDHIEVSSSVSLLSALSALAQIQTEAIP
jgi:hypothetical protein